MRQKLRVSSCMAPNMDQMVVDLADWLTAELNLPVEFADNLSWRQREQAFDQGEIDLLWICGLPYVWKADDPERSVKLVAAPVMAADRYRGRPVYYSDVLVRGQSSYASFSDLAGARWAINEPKSHSGYNLTRWYLAENGLDWHFFRSVQVAGSHEMAIDLLLQGEVDAAAIDCTVWEQANRTNPELESKLRSVLTLGPSPIPPWIVQDKMKSGLFERLQSALLAIGSEKEGAAVLEKAGIKRMVAVSDRDYDRIREMEQIARQVPAPEWAEG